MRCPRCGSDTSVIRTHDKITYTFRRRMCKNKKCKWRFNTKEMRSDGWNYKAVVDDIWDELKKVKMKDGREI